ncbi:Abi-alpha family protein [Pseudomonas maioricensis]|nr:Abi-alpha family protein [Pseudomonas sp. S25]
MTENNKSLDILGAKPLSESVKTMTEGTVQGVSALLSRICLPAAEEFGLLLKDKVGNWRSNNAAKMAAKANQILEGIPFQETLSAHPKIAFKAVEDSSWTDDDVVLSLWAGLLVSSCTKSGKDESNLIFLNLLSQLTSSQVRVLKYACENAKVFIAPSGWIMAGDLRVEAMEIVRITNVTDMHQLDRELDHLRQLGVIENGFDVNSTKADITPTSLGLQLYVRSQGYVGSPIAFFEMSGPVEVKDPSEVKGRIYQGIFSEEFDLPEE